MRKLKLKSVWCSVTLPSHRFDAIGRNAVEELGRELVEFGAVDEARVLIAQERAEGVQLGQRVGLRLARPAVQPVVVGQGAADVGVLLEGAPDGGRARERLGGSECGGDSDQGDGEEESFHVRGHFRFKQ